jgi:hypothetical protein
LLVRRSTLRGAVIYKYSARICKLLFALDLERMISFVVTHAITVFPYCVIDYYHLRFEVDISDSEDNCTP